MLKPIQRRLFALSKECICPYSGLNAARPPSQIVARCFSTSKSWAAESRSLGEADANHQHRSLDDAIAQEKDKQARAPWHREGSHLPPVRRARSASAMTKGKLLTTPSRLLKLIIPLTTRDHNSDRKSVQPLALLVHPQQPLSYLERLIQSELPVVTTKDNEQKIPAVHFKAEDFATDEIKPQRFQQDENDEEQGEDSVSFDGKIERTGKISGTGKEQEKTGEVAEQAQKLRGGPGEGGVESYSGAGHENKSDGQQRFVRWSSSTEIGDFIRDAARGKEFAVEIEGAEEEIRVGVPSFNDRTHFLRTRLRKLSRQIADLAAIKQQCDKLAHRSAQRFAMGGFGGMVGWWGLVYYLTFKTDLGWDVMEPVTYLVGLSTVMGSALWFIYHNREMSYRSALNLTVSRRQNQLYNSKGFDLQKWEALVQEANALRSEIKNVANEYDVEWDERSDEHDETVTEALKQERETKKQKGDNDGKEDKD